MSGDLEQIKELAGALLRNLAPAERRRLLRAMAREIRASQSARIGQQRDPDGRPYAPRRAKREERPGAYAVKFLHPKGAAEPRVVFMKSWVRQGPMITGYDIEAGGIRSFFADQVAQWLPVAREDQKKAGGKLRRRGTIRQRAMFRKLRAKALGSGATDREAWVGFSGRAAAVARVHQEGRMDRPSRKAKAVRYTKRGLLGIDNQQTATLVSTLLAYVSTVQS